VTLTEAPTAADHGWCHSRAHEVVIPMASTAAPARAPAVVSRAGPLPLIGPEHGLMPGSSVLYAKLYGNPDTFDTDPYRPPARPANQLGRGAAVVVRALPAPGAALAAPPAHPGLRHERCLGRGVGG